MWKRLASFLRGGKPVAVGCSAPTLTLVKGVSWEAPPARNVSAAQQAQAIVTALQDEGRTGVVPRGEILRLYAEHCLMLGFVPVKHNALCEALGEILEKRRPLVDGHRITAYVVPHRHVAANVVQIPNGNKEDIPWPELPKSTRAGTAYAQA